MSKISSIYDAIPTAVEAVLTGYKRMPNAYEPEKCPTTILEKGYGVTMGPAENPSKDQSLQLQVRRQFAVIMSRILPGDLDAAAQQTIEKALLEDQLLVIRTFERGALSSLAPICRYFSDGGITYLDVGEGGGRYLLLANVFALQYAENLQA